MNIKKTWIGLLLVLGLRFGQYYYQLPERVGGEVVTIRGVLGSEPAQANGRQTLSLDGLYVSVRTPPEFHYGDEVMVEGKLLCYDTFRCIRGRIERARVSLVAQDQGGLLGLPGEDEVSGRLLWLFEKRRSQSFIRGPCGEHRFRQDL